MLRFRQSSIPNSFFLGNSAEPFTKWDIEIDLIFLSSRRTTGIPFLSITIVLPRLLDMCSITWERMNEFVENRINFERTNALNFQFSLYVPSTEDNRWHLKLTKVEYLVNLLKRNWTRAIRLSAHRDQQRLRVPLRTSDHGGHSRLKVWIELPRTTCRTRIFIKVIHTNCLRLPCLPNENVDFRL